MTIIHQVLVDDRKAPQKQRHTAQRIFEVLREEHGFDGKLPIVKETVRACKLIHADLYVPLDHPSGKV